MAIEVRKDVSPYPTLIQQFECVVISLDDECAWCELHDLTDFEKPVEFAGIYLTEWHAPKVLHEGYVFYWCIWRHWEGYTYACFRDKPAAFPKIAPNLTE